MKKILSSLVLALVISLSLASCSLGDDSAMQTVKSTNSDLTLEIPASWSEQNLNSIASIQMARLTKEQYLITIEESAIDFADEFTLEEYSSIIMGNMQNAVTDLEGIPVIEDVKVGNDIDAKQFELTCAVDKIKVKYLVTCIDVDGTFYQFVQWSLQSKYDAAKPVFDDILKSTIFN